MATAHPPPQKEYFIGGVKVLFPVKPYPSQMAMMAQIVKGLKRRQNCLLESPTGSGKSLALLCSTLAWHQAEKEKAERYNDLINQGVTDPDILARAAGLTNVPSTQGPQNVPSTQGPQNVPSTQGSQMGPQMGPPSTPQAPRVSQDSFNLLTQPSTPADPAAAAAAVAAAATGGGFIPEDEGDSDFRSQTRQFRIPVGVGAPPGGMDESSFMDVDSSFMGEEIFNPQVQQPAKMRVPKIYFGTRTHKQIDQIMKELRRTAYKHVKTTVLSSRERTCIHPGVSKMRNKNEGCQQLNDPREGTGCRFKDGVAKIKTHDRLSHHGIQPAWDIEDLVTLGKKIRTCPYFSARALMETADVVFCPYNYLIDPFIRDSMSIDLKNQVIILDEAHNIEDSSRESTSCTIRQEEIVEAIQELDKMATLEFCIEECRTLSQMLNALSGWLDLNKENLTDYQEFDRSGKIFTGTEMVAHLDHLKIGHDRYDELKRCLTTVSADQDPEENNPRLKTPTLMILKALFLMLHFLFLDNMKYRDDYRIAVVKSQIRNAGRRNSDGFFSKRGSLGWEFSLNFWCLNPGVAFLSVGTSARSVILTSGTLSPMSSFQSELATPFPIQLEANHVIDKSQVWVGTISRGPTDQALQATYRHVETWQFQDELGRLVLNVCQVIPHGVLCFLPSYAMLNKLLDRWQNTGLWDEISKIKIALTEPRKSDEFEATMALFYDTIRDTKDAKMDCGLNGAFFMAVCRGKVSEGLDFTDDNARAVISVGIPFPNVKDIKVDLKRQYNNQHCKSRGLLPGSEWYEIQAYRALNQALGRCIRHRYDWGALILVDERYQQGMLSGGMQPTKYTRGLSKWVRNKIVHHPNFAMALSNLRQFAENMVANPPVKPESLDESLIVGTNPDSVKQNEMPLNRYNKHDLGSFLNTTTDSSINIVTPSESSFKSDPKPSASEGYSSQSGSLTNPSLTQMEETIFNVEGLDTSVVGGLNSNLEDPDFMSSQEDLVIPPSRIPITSTQISGVKGGVLSILPIGIPSTLTQISESDNDSLVLPSDKIPSLPSPARGLIPFGTVSSTPNQSSKVKSENQSSAFVSCESETEISVIPKHVDNSCFNKPNDLMKTPPFASIFTKTPSRKRKSFALTVEDIGQHSTTRDLKTGVSAVLSCDNENLKSPVKAHLPKESSATHEGQQSRESGNDKGNCSPQMFDSDEDLFADSSPTKTVLKSCEIKFEGSKEMQLNSASCRRESITKGINYNLDEGVSWKSPCKDSNTITSSTKDKDADFGKENKCSKKIEISNFPSQLPVNTLDDTTLDDSDMDDFCLNKSYNNPKAKKDEKTIKKQVEFRRRLR